MTRINHYAVVAAAILQQALGFVWYSHALFADPWMRGIGKTPDQLKPMPGPFAVAVAAALLLAYGLDWLLRLAGARGWVAGVRYGAIVGFALVMPAVLVHEAFLGYPPSVLAIDGAKEVVGAILAGAVIGAWPRRG